MQQQRVREKSLANLGEMAAGAAHEMNNPLMVISGRAQLLSAKITDAGMKGEACLIAQQADRLSQIITDMMEFAKPLTPKMAALDVAAMMEDAAKHASERAGSPQIKVKIETSRAVPQVRGDAKQLGNALAEIILNAIQAARTAAETDGGKRNHEEVHVHASHDPLDGRVIVQVTDHGIGMTQDVAKNAFAPFFSAKAAGRNRGMGLAKALRWVENHGGTIRLDSTPGQGTTAVLILPVNGAVSETPALVAARR